VSIAVFNPKIAISGKTVPGKRTPLTVREHFPIFLSVNELRQSHSVKIPAFAGMTSSAGMTIQEATSLTLGSFRWKL
jgi:hypothetical protein